MATVVMVDINTNKSDSRPKVTYDPSCSEQEIENAVKTAAPGWEIDWDATPWAVDHGRLALPLRRRAAGRPSRASTAAGDKVTIRATSAERAAWESAAGDRALADWIRNLCNAAAPTVRR